MGESGPPTAEGAELSRNEIASIDELRDRLNEKTDKFNYFMVTTSTAVLIFTFNDFNARAGLLRSAPIWLVACSWAALVMSAVASLLSIRQGHLLYRLYIRIRSVGRSEPNSQESSRIQRIYVYRRIGEATMIAGVLLGVSGLAAGYIAAIVD